MNSSVDSTITLVQLNAQETCQWGHSAKLTAHTLLKASKADVHVMKTHGERRGIATLILTLGAGWKCVVNFIPWPLYPLRKNPGNHWWAPEEAWTFCRTGKSPNPAGSRTPDQPARSLIIIPTAIIVELRHIADFHLLLHYCKLLCGISVTNMAHHTTKSDQ